VTESRERVRAALVASGLALPARRITVKLAPADLPKEGSHYDLPVALAVMAAIGAIPTDALDGYAVIGELALDGTISAVAGVLPEAIAANARGLGLVCPAACGPEAAWASAELDILAPRSLIQLANHFKGSQILSRPTPALRAAGGPQPDLADIKGQESAKRALEVAAAAVTIVTPDVASDSRLGLGRPRPNGRFWPKTDRPLSERAGGQADIHCRMAYGCCRPEGDVCSPSTCVKPVSLWVRIG
jgi:predicted ATPase with chaperone activity